MRYVLVTAARNEEAYIGHTLRAVVGQTAQPVRWVIANDGSTDRTAALVTEFAAANPWIRLLEMPPGAVRDFSRKALCVRAAFDSVRTESFDIVGNVDGDVSFVPDYMSYLLARFAENPRLGVAGTPYTEGAFNSFADSYVDEQHVHGQIQLFRRQCFEDIGGYVPIPSGGIDSVAVTMARMRGWETRSFRDRTFVHHRAMGTAGSRPLRALFHAGRKEYFFGNHPLWELFRCAFQAGRKPYLLRGLCLFAGYASCAAAGKSRPVPPELVRFHRREQMQRLRALVWRRLQRGR